MTLEPPDPRLYEPENPDECPACGEPAGDEMRCESCGTVLDVYEWRAAQEEAFWDRRHDELGER